MIDWVAVENAVWAWIRAASGLSDDRVIWAGRSPAPSTLYLSLSIATAATIASDRVDRERIEDAEPGVEDELRYVVRGDRAATLEIQCLPAVGDPETGVNMAVAVLERAIAGRLLPTIAEALAASPVGVGRIGVIRRVGRSADGVFEARAVVEVTLHLAGELAATGPAIGFVETEGELDPGDLVVDDWVPEEPVES